MRYKIIIHTMFVVMALCLINLPAYADDKYLDIQEVKTETGITAWLVEDHSVPIIAMNFAFENAGAKNDPTDKQGLTRLASNTMDEGAGDIKSQEFQKLLRDLSITLSFGASRDHFSGTFKTLTQNKEKAFELLKLALTAPRFDEEPVGRMRAANQSRIKASMADPDWIAARIQNDVIFEGHPYALNSGGTLSSLDAITPDDLRTFHKRLGKNNLIIAVAGDISADELRTRIDSVFGSLPVVEQNESAVFEMKNEGKTYLYEQDIPQTMIEISQPGIGRSDKDYYAAKIMNFILGESGFGSRLMEEIREKRGLTYGIYSYLRDYEDTDIMHVSTSTVNESVPEMIKLIRQEWIKMQSSPVTDTELMDAKSYIIGSLPLALTSTDAIASTMLSMQLDDLPVDYLDHRAEKFDAVTVLDIQNVAKRLLNDKKWTVVLVGQPNGVESPVTIKDIPNVE